MYYNRVILLETVQNSTYKKIHFKIEYKHISYETLKISKKNILKNSYKFLFFIVYIIFLKIKFGTLANNNSKNVVVESQLLN